MRRAGSYLPFALNVLTLRGTKISDVTAFVMRSTQVPDSAAFERWPEQPAEPARLAAFFERFGLPDRLD